ncbi:MAG: phosphotransferase [Euzebyales bacterium]|nr:phosphotransferase [Euzebyales bacterium]
MRPWFGQRSAARSRPAKSVRVRGRARERRSRPDLRFRPPTAPPSPTTSSGAPEYIEGDHLADLPPPQQEAVVRDLIVAQGHLAAGEGEGSTAALLEGALLVADRVEIPASLRAELARERTAIEALAERCPLVPVHGDMSSDNLVVRNGRPVLIDLEGRGCCHSATTRSGCSSGSRCEGTAGGSCRPTSRGCSIRSCAQPAPLRTCPPGRGPADGCCCSCCWFAAT